MLIWLIVAAIIFALWATGLLVGGTTQIQTLTADGGLLMQSDNIKVVWTPGQSDPVITGKASAVSVNKYGKYADVTIRKGLGNTQTFAGYQWKL
jgi:hypothetical protein